MSVEKIEAATIGIDNLGLLEFDSGWREAKHAFMVGITHAVSTAAIFVEPKHVLYWHNLWDRHGDGVNSKKRFSHMISLSSVPILGGSIEYQESLTEAI